MCTSSFVAIQREKNEKKEQYALLKKKKKRFMCKSWYSPPSLPVVVSVCLPLKKKEALLETFSCIGLGKKRGEKKARGENEEENILKMPKIQQEKSVG